MQTLLDMGSNQNSTIVFPIPIELIRPLLAAPVPMKAVAAGNGRPPTAETPLSSWRRSCVERCARDRHGVTFAQDDAGVDVELARTGLREALTNWFGPPDHA